MGLALFKFEPQPKQDESYVWQRSDEKPRDCWRQGGVLKRNSYVHVVDRVAADKHRVPRKREKK